jgi:putative inorganic carbon (HCO3(-)) transporter
MKSATIHIVNRIQLNGLFAQILFAAAATAFIALPWIVVPIPVVPLILALGLLGVLFALYNPLLICLTFFVFSYFRIHEAFPVLNPLRLPSLLGILTIVTVSFNFMKRSVVPYWPMELKAFICFFAIVTFGMTFATDFEAASEFWTSTYSKIALMTLIFAWLPRTSRDFALAANLVILSGIAVGAAAIFNKVMGIGLVEETRVTIGRDIGSVLGDPNDLAFVLLLPLSFCLAVLLLRVNVVSTLLGIVGAPVVLGAMIFTQSRGGLIGIATILFILGLFRSKSKLRLCCAGLVVLGALYSAMGIDNRVSGGTAEEGVGEAALERIDTWSAALKMAGAHPLSGVGIDNFSPNYRLYSGGLASGPTTTVVGSETGSKQIAVHSTWLGVMAETGVPGFIAFSTMIAVSLLASMRSLQTLVRAGAPTAVSSVALALCAALVGYSTAGLFLTQAFTWPFYFLIALTAALSRFTAGYKALHSQSRLAPIPSGGANTSAQAQALAGRS